MALPVVIKGGRNYITLVLDKDMDFAELLNHIVQKFIESEKFFQDAQIALMFSGRRLSHSEECIILDAIAEYTTIHITNILDYEEFTNQAAILLQEQEDKLSTEADLTDDCVFYERSIKAGERIEADKTIIVKGNVEIGAILKTKENIIVLGSLLGQAIAGIGKEECKNYILALDFEPENFRIGTTIGMSLKKKRNKTSWKNKIAKKAQKAYICDGVIQIEQLFK